MNTKRIFGFFVTVLALAVLISVPVSAFADIQQVVIEGIEINNIPSADVISVDAGNSISIGTTFLATGNDEEVRVTARILGEPGTFVDTAEFAVIAGGIYGKTLTVDLPSDLDDNKDEPLTLEITIEGKTEGVGDREEIKLHIQRENDFLEILAIESDSEVKAGETLALEVVVHNNGRNEADETFVRASIKALGVNKMVFLGDLDATEDDDPDKEDSALGVIFLVVPKNAPAGVYNVEIEAFNADSSTFATRKVVVVGGGADSIVISSASSKTFAVGEDQQYTITVVNSDDTIRVYELVLEAANGLTIDMDESVIAVPAGSSRTVKLMANANEEGNFNFAVNVHSNGELVQKQSFIANVEGKAVAAGNAAVVLTIILAIIFVVLLIVLIVLLTRKPEKSGEDFGESYY